MRIFIGLPLFLIALIVLLILSAFFSASETALIALGKIRVRHLVAKGIKHAANIQRLVTKLDKLIATILIGNNFVNIAISAIVTAMFVYFFGTQWGIVISTFSVTLIVLIFGEITPKILAIRYSERIAIFVAPLMEVFVSVFDPLVHSFTHISNLIIRLCGGQPPKRSPLITEEELRLMIEVGKEEGVLTDEERKMLHRIFEFGDIKVGDVMVPKAKMVAIDIKSEAEKLLDLLVEEGHSRIPVYRGCIDNIIGVIYAHDLLHLWKNKELFVLSDLVHAPYQVPSEIKVNDLLQEFQKRRIQIAIVVDKDKKTLGLVTLEDLIEEIVGEIEQELIDKKKKL